MKKRALLLILAGVVGAAILVRVVWRPRGAGRRYNVLLITLDTTRADRVGCYGYASALTPALDCFVELFDIDEDLIQVAAERSSDLGGEISDDDLRQAIGQLSTEERDAFLLRLARGEPHLSLALNHRLGAFRGTSHSETGERHTVGELLATMEAQRERQRRERAAAAEARRIAELKALSGREDKAWREVDALIQQSQAKAYDGAVQLLKKLGDLAEHQGRRSVFEERLGQIRERYSRRSALLRRLREAGLVDQRGAG